MKKTRIVGAILAGIMMLTAVPATAETLSVVSVAASKLDAPKSFKASDVSGTAAKLTWKAVKGATGYRVFMYNAKTKKFEKYKNVSSTSCNVTGLTLGKTYKFQVAALVKSGNKTKVQTKTDTLSVTTKLSAPANVKVTKGGTAMRLTWNAVKGASGYTVYMYNPKTKKFAKYKNVSTPACNVTGLTVGTKYRFKIAALVKKNKKYVPQTFTKVKAATAALAAPTGVKAQTAGTAMRLTWNKVNGAAGYRVYMYNSKTKKFETYKNVASAACNITGLTIGSKYRFKIAALIKVKGKYVAQTPTNGKSATAKYAAPSGVKAKVSDTLIRLTWNEIKGVAGYRVLLYNASTKKFEKYKDVASPLCNATGLTGGKKYIFRIAALVKTGNTYAIQTYTKALSAVTKLPPPTNLKATVTGSTVKLTWNAVKGAYAYRVYSYDPNTKIYRRYKNMATTSCTMINVKPGVYRFSIATLTAQNKKLIEQMRTSVVTVTVSGSSTAVTSKEHVSGYRYGTTKYPTKHDIEYMKKLSSDFIGWLQIKDTPIDLPVVQASNNEYYLTHTFYGENDPTKVGTTFADSHVKVTATSRPDNLIIYGHNIYTGVGLAKITNYYPARYGSLNFYLTHPTFTYESAYGGEKTYVVFAGMFVNTETKHGNVFNYYKFRNFSSESQFYQYFEQVFDRSVFYNPDLNIKYGEKFITLSTCFYPYGKDVDTRFVVFARELRKGETVTTARAYQNKSPLYFDYYYKVNGGKWAGRAWSSSLMQGYADWKKKNP